MGTCYSLFFVIFIFFPLFEPLYNLDVFIFYFWHKLKYSLALGRLDSSLLLKFSKIVLKKATRINNLILLFTHEF